MKKKAATTTRNTSAKTRIQGLAPLIAEVRDLIRSARQAAATTVNRLQVLTNFEIGRRIVDHEQRGEKRASYGKELLRLLSVQLTDEFGKGFSLTNLKLMRQFFLEYRERIGRLNIDPLMPSPIGQQATDQSSMTQVAAGKLNVLRPPKPGIFRLSWTHYVLLLTIKNPDERSFYEIEEITRQA